MVTQHPGRTAPTVNGGCAAGQLLWLESCDSRASLVAQMVKNPPAV